MRPHPISVSEAVSQSLSHNDQSGGECPNSLSQSRVTLIRMEDVGLRRRIFSLCDEAVDFASTAQLIWVCSLLLGLCLMVVVVATGKTALITTDQRHGMGPFG